MLKRAPSVYVPIEPDDNGVTLPTILSIFVHGSILAFIILSHRVPSIDTQSSIETTIVSPQELASMQAEIKANREFAEQEASFNDDNIDDSTNELSETSNANDTKSVNQFKESSKPQPANQRSQSIFKKSDAPADAMPNIEDMPENAGYNEQYEKNRQQYEDAQAEFQEILEQEMEEKQKEYQKYLAERQAREAERLKSFQDKRSSPSVDVQSSNNNETKSKIKTEKKSNSSNNQNQSFDLAKDGKPLAGNKGINQNKPQADISNELINLIKPYWNPPDGRSGNKLSAIVKVDSGGMVISVNVKSNDIALKQSLENAINDASPLTPVIGTKNRNLKLNFVVD